MPPLAPLPRRSVVDEAFDALRAQILHGHWRAGDKLPTEAELTESLAVSRSTVREALNRLASAGLVEIPHGGTKRVRDFRDHAGLEVLSALVVSPTGQIHPGVVRSVTEMRAAIAPDIARLAATNRTDDQAQALLRRSDALDPSAPLDRLLLETLAWWTTLVLASDNIAYRLAYNTLRSTYMEGRPVLRDVLAPELRAADRYQRISRAVADREPLHAEAGCRALVALGTDAITTALQALAAHGGS